MRILLSLMLLPLMVLPTAQQPGRLLVVNEATIAARVVDDATGWSTRTMAGTKRVMKLSVWPQNRVLVVEIGTHRYVTLPFNPDDVLPCWRLTIRQPPQRPDGPWPIDCNEISEPVTSEVKDAST